MEGRLWPGWGLPRPTTVVRSTLAAASSRSTCPLGTVKPVAVSLANQATLLVHSTVIVIVVNIRRHAFEGISVREIVI